LFTELSEIERNKTILDKQDFYIYFCDITFSKVKYPIFYIPISINKKDNQLEIEFDSQVYINKKAIEYIVQESGRKGNIDTATERIIYLSQYKTDLKDHINKILSGITNFFELNSSVDIEDSTQQVAKSSTIKVSNACYIALFDKSDEALVNDYEEILSLLTDGDSLL